MRSETQDPPLLTHSRGSEGRRSRPSRPVRHIELSHAPVRAELVVITRGNPMPTMVEAQRSHRHDEPKQQPKPTQQPTEPTAAPSPESARSALQQSMERRW